MMDSPSSSIYAVRVLSSREGVGVCVQWGGLLDFIFYFLIKKYFKNIELNQIILKN